MRGGVQSPSEAHGRRSRHSTQSAGKPRTGGKGGRGVTLFWSNSCLVLPEVGANRWSRKIIEAAVNAKNMTNPFLWEWKSPLPGEPDALKGARPVRRGVWGNTVRLCALRLPYQVEAGSRANRPGFKVVRKL